MFLIIGKDDFDMSTMSLPLLSTCRNLLDSPELKYLPDALDGNREAQSKCLAAWILLAEKKGLQGNLLRQVLLYRLIQDKNIVSDIIERNNGRIGNSLREAFRRDMTILSPFLSDCSAVTFPEAFMLDYVPTSQTGEKNMGLLAEVLGNATTPEEYAEGLLAYYTRYGYGDLASSEAFYWDTNKKQIIGIPHFTSMRLEDIIGYAHQKEQLLGNTQAFLANKPANNALLVGARGTGKSSAVKALAGEYAAQGLRLVQITKQQIAEFPAILEALQAYTSKHFIIFLDDLSFEPTDEEYKYLKSVIEGGIFPQPENVLIYATSNRRHLIHEDPRLHDSQFDDVYRTDSINETISLSDRFGLIINYYSPDQKEYLAIIDHMLRKEGITLSSEELRIAGVRWEMTHSGRNGRTAKQFVRHFLGQEM